MFTVAVKIDGMDRRRRTTGLLHVVMGCFLLIKSLDLQNYLLVKSILPLLPFTAVGALSLGYGIFRKRLDSTAKYNGSIRILQCISFFCFGILMLRLHRQLDYITLFVWSFITLLLQFSEKKIFAPSIITINTAGVLIPGNYKNHLVTWTVLESVVVRHDFITLLHHDKKYLQYQVLQDLSELEVVKMNAFCKERIENKLIG